MCQSVGIDQGVSCAGPVALLGMVNYAQGIQSTHGWVNCNALNVGCVMRCYVENLALYGWENRQAVLLSSILFQRRNWHYYLKTCVVSMIQQKHNLRVWWNQVQTQQ